jgi:hypothetical protein
MEAMAINQLSEIAKAYTDSNVCSLFRIRSWILMGQCSETFVCRIDDVKCLRVSISMNELLQLNVNKFGEKFITYTNQIYRLISKLRRVCRITTYDLHRWDNSQTDEIRRNDDKYWYFLMVFFVDRCNLSYLNFHVNMLSMEIVRLNTIYDLQTPDIFFDK